MPKNLAHVKLKVSLVLSSVIQCIAVPTKLQVLLLHQFCGALTVLKNHVAMSGLVMMVLNLHYRINV